MNRQSLRSGFTLVELLVVVAIIALLLAILLPSIQRAMYNAKIVVCLSNLRQIGVGVLTYGADNEGLYPHGQTSFASTTPTYGDGNYGRDVMYSWAVYQTGNPVGQPVHNMVTVLSNYFGGVDSMRKTFLCALMRQDWQNKMKKTSNLWYGTNSGQQSYSLMWCIQGRDDWGIRTGMYKIGQRWQQGKRAASYTGLWFNVVAGDMISYWQYGGPRASHYEWGGSPTFKETTGCGGYEYNDPTSGNFLTDDGAAKTFNNMWPGMPGVAGTSGFLVPGDYAATHQ